MIAFTAISLCFVRVPHDLAAVEPSDALTFGTGHAGVEVSDNETTVFTHKINDGHVGVMTHFWSTCGPEVEAGLLVRYYVDGETTLRAADGSRGRRRDHGVDRLHAAAGRGRRL